MDNLTRRSARRLRLENLEERWMLAGNVTAEVMWGSLIITGDNNDNGISIVPGNNPGDYVVQGTDVNGLTSVNGKPQEYLRGVRWSAHIDMEGGADEVTVDGCEFAWDLAIQTGPRYWWQWTGDGDDTIEITNSLIHGDVICETGAGSDRVDLIGVAIKDALTILTQDDWHDVVDNDTINLIGVDVAWNAWLRTGVGMDTVQINESQFGWDLYVDTGACADDVDIMYTNVRFNANIQVHGGDDTLDIEYMNVGQMTYITTDTPWDRFTPDDDTVNIRYLATSYLFLDTGKGDDDVLLADSSFRWGAFVVLGSGNDELTIEDLVGGGIWLDGRAGHDTLNDNGGHTLRNILLWSFEVIT